MTTPRKFFLAIRHKPSGGFLPAVKGYGFTRTKPTLDEPPRLFTKTGPARQALNRWLEGELYEGIEQDDWETGGTSITIKCIKKPERQIKEMELVEIELIVRSLSEAQLRVL